MNNISNVTNERLHEYLDKRMCNVTEEFRVIVRELLARRDAAEKPVAYSYKYAGCETCEGFQDWRDELSEEEPPEWMVETGKVTNLIPLFTTPPLPVVPQALLRELVDVVWQDAKESAEVPATSHADRLILQAFGNSEQVNSFLENSETSTNYPEIPDGWTDNNAANSALVMLNRIDTLDSADDVRIEEIGRIIRQLATAPKPEVG